MPSTVVNTDEYELVHLTEREVIEFTRRQNAEAWKGRLSAEDYVLREHVLGKSKITSSDVNRLMVFMLKKVNDTIPLCSIEFLIRKSWKFVYENDKVVQKEVLSGCIGGVFTYPENRGKGYAKIMVDKLVEIAKSDLLGPEGFTFLYSEIGEYYSKNGFLSLGVDLMNIPLENSKVDKDVKDCKYELIDYHQFEPLMNEYAEKFKEDIIAKVEQDHITRVGVVPTSDIVDWFHLRSKYISYKLFQEDNAASQSIDFYNESYDSITYKLEHCQPKKFGLKLFNDNGDLAGFIVWTIDWSSLTENYATILKIVSFDENKAETTTKLLKLFKNFIISNPIVGQTTTKIVLWESEVCEPVKSFLIEKWGSKHGLYNGSRSAILINNKLEDSQLRQGQVIWEGNDKLPWF
ncbi:uncharacterized protein J8A68_004757 [[Candida] subhashii]|uniref:LYC1 C-terminal domain-containing protein n=1 Tax=[Candida] subhashii TaxID=561895 RepID=A0A8J5UWL7_9ASCO|nr:uncharacterized protein J8A68_004757 [[Candida] subhashii]KAG7661699.1 hypothetical protein J8A68_004757 [[Candida] subhashii]